MDKGVSAGSVSTLVVGRVALGITLLALGLGTAGGIDGVGTSDAVTLGRHAGGVALFLVGLVALRDRDTARGTGFVALLALTLTLADGSARTKAAAGWPGSPVRWPVTR
ncbi:hypothetical protein ABZ079_01060 [Streptomyces sp. NPDC006314]|uniref:hypothetical protein n=1 Tax=Streptomyces sp. NPDC006314 TaxID=3154475 RepID=UPI0033B3CDAF